MAISDDDRHAELAHPEWFRAPNRHEHFLAAGLFVGFGIFFVALFIINLGWWFRWIILVLGIFSIMQGIRHLRTAIRQ